MEEDLNDVVPCTSSAIDSLLRVGTAGTIWGLCSGPHEARKKGLTGIAQASHVTKAVAKSGSYCGLVAGVFSFTRCGLQRYRGRNDAINALIAGAVAGAAVAAVSRSCWTEVFRTAGVVSVICVAADSFKPI